MLEELKEIVCKANLDFVDEGMVMQTFGNVSGIDRNRRLIVIQPSSVDYSCMNPEKMVVVSLETGKVVEGDLNPSSDTPTHLVLIQGIQAEWFQLHEILILLSFFSYFNCKY
jgi:L-ribulose-5-phosphate 4-epimerase